MSKIETIDIRFSRFAAVPVMHNREIVDNIQVDMSRMSPECLSYLVNYGLRQNLNDAKASATTLADAQNLMQKRLERLYNDDFGKRGASAGEPVSPVEREALKIAREQVNKALRDRGIKKMDDAAKNELVVQYAATPAIMEEAKRRVAVAASLANITLPGENAEGAEAVENKAEAA